MRLAHRVWTGIAAGVFALVAVTDLAGGDDAARPAAVTAAVPPDAARAWTSAGAGSEPVDAPAVRPAAPPAQPAAPAGIRVTRVVDGDTVETADGRTVQVLGIDACEAGTRAGERATQDLRWLLEGETVVLTAEPGVALDRHGHDLRYLALPAGDVGEQAVGHDHTGVYRGHGASPERIAALMAADDGVQVCDDPAVPTAVDPDLPDVDWPSQGDQGLPDGALTGGFCARKWWC